MFAPRPEVAIAEVHRVLKRNGRIAFATWPPEHVIGRFFAFIGRNSPPLPSGASSPPQWGNPAIIAERLGTRFGAPFFERGTMAVPALSLEHYRLFMDRSVGPMQKLVECLATERERLTALRAEFHAMVAPYYSENVVHQDYLLTRAQALELGARIPVYALRADFDQYRASSVQTHGFHRLICYVFDAEPTVKIRNSTYIF